MGTKSAVACELLLSFLFEFWINLSEFPVLCGWTNCSPQHEILQFFFSSISVSFNLRCALHHKAVIFLHFPEDLLTSRQKRWDNVWIWVTCFTGCWNVERSHRGCHCVLPAVRQTLQVMRHVALMNRSLWFLLADGFLSVNQMLDSKWCLF